jgi:hypothetical protein
MATRMQQRKGTAAQWISTNGGDGPVLNPGEIGFESDTNKFKIGDGVNHWVDLTYFTDADSALAAVTDLIGGAPDLLNTLNELAAAVNDDPAFFTTVATNLSNHQSDTTNIHGIADTSLLATQSYAVAAAEAEVTSHNSTTTDVHGIADTEDLETEAGAQAKIDAALSAHSQDTTNIHGIADTSVLETTTGAQSKVDTAMTAHEELTTNVHGIADTEDLETINGAQTKADTAVSTHNSDTTSVHGIADTSILATTTGSETLSNKTLASPTITVDSTTVSATEISYLDGVTSGIQTQLNAKAPTADPTFTGTVAGITKTMVGLGNVDNTTDANKPVSTATQAALDLKAPLADPTFTGTVSGVTKSHVGLGNLDNTSDANKPVSTATQTALDAKASLAGAVFTGNVEVDGSLVVDGDFTVNGTNFSASATSITIEDNLLQLAHTNPANTVDLGLVVAYNDGTAKHAGIARDVSDNKWKLFNGVTTEPTTTVAFGEGSLDALAVGAFEATTVTPSSGVVFSDGTQTKEGVPSRTPIVQKTASYALSTLTHRDSLIEVSSTNATTITIPEDSTVDYPIGTTLDILQTNTGQVTIAPVSGSVTVNATPGLKLRTRWSSATLMKRAANTWVVFGDLTA